MMRLYSSTASSSASAPRSANTKYLRGLLQDTIRIAHSIETVHGPGAIESRHMWEVVDELSRKLNTLEFHYKESLESRSFPKEELATRIYDV